jgi:hypothetical protein
MNPSKTKKEDKAPSEKPFDELLHELISKRKTQQEALLKIKASVARKQQGSSRNS